MGLIESVVDAVTEGEQGGKDTCRYRCVECEERFERAKGRMVALRCPDCGSMNVRVVDGAAMTN
jgi:Zn finger protein HypA/HybF involved in hydrogenase expression